MLAPSFPGHPRKMNVVDFYGGTNSLQGAHRNQREGDLRGLLDSRQRHLALAEARDHQVKHP